MAIVRINKLKGRMGVQEHKMNRRIFLSTVLAAPLAALIGRFLSKSSPQQPSLRLVGQIQDEFLFEGDAAEFQRMLHISGRQVGKSYKFYGPFTLN
jgi:hypothetical protein